MTYEPTMISDDNVQYTKKYVETPEVVNTTQGSRAVALENIMVIYNTKEYRGSEIWRNRVTSLVVGLPNDTLEVTYPNSSGVMQQLNRLDFLAILQDILTQQNAILSGN